MTHPTTTSRGWICALLLTLWALSGCRHGASATDTPRPDRTRQVSDIALSQHQQQQPGQEIRTRPGRFQPSLGPGWTMHRTVIPTGSDAVYRFVDAAGTCRPADPDLHNSELTESQKQALAANGLSLSLVPVDQVEHILSLMGTDPSLESTWLGNVTRWKSIAAGPAIHSRTVYNIDDQYVEYSSGYAQILMRGYPLQSVNGPYMWLELIPHFRQPPDNPYAVAANAEQEIIGDFLTSCGVRLALDGRCAVAIMPMRQPEQTELPLPDNQSDQPPARMDENRNQTPEPTPETQQPDREPDTAASTPPPPIYGPEPIPILNAGHEILCSDDENRMLVIILIPAPTQPEASPTPEPAMQEARPARP